MQDMQSEFYSRALGGGNSAPPDRPGIVLTSVSKSWGGAEASVELSLTVPAGKFTAILGPSGCGKSTTLRLIGGLEIPDAGTITIAGRDVTRVSPAERDIAMVFQSYALFPHLNVEENILFGMKVRRLPRAEQSIRLAEATDLLGLGALLKRKPAQLSGGQQQRVALARAIVSQKSVFLLDEPLSNLDAKLRQDMRHEIRALQQKLGVTMVYVTHDQIEAVTMADQVVLMNRGRVEQMADPRTLYDQPASMFAAGFIGTPPMNLFPVQTLDPTAVLPGFDASATLGIRPESLVICESGPISVCVLRSEFQGADTIVTVDASAAALTIRCPGNVSLPPGLRLRVGFRAADLHVFATDLGQRREDLRDFIRGGLDKT